MDPDYHQFVVDNIEQLSSLSLQQRYPQEKYKHKLFSMYCLFEHLPHLIMKDGLWCL